MAKLSKAANRDRKLRKRRYGMRIDNRNIHHITEAQKKRDLEIAQLRKEKEDFISEAIDESKR